ncbi:BQ2448_1699 [Microbotryum intermedium]|uniref:BQ2448_1699 protein n=1 Tax=Microbotryum intermedium TaxID=269621 RepID=A0A238FAR7_9BASI|nr:BQ2448_1699 [Microbotryum intermedium]
MCSLNHHIAPLKQGVARILSDTLTRHEHDHDFKVEVQTCSITYLHRDLFRSEIIFAGTSLSHRRFRDAIDVLAFLPRLNRFGPRQTLDETLRQTNVLAQTVFGAERSVQASTGLFFVLDRGPGRPVQDTKTKA